jgi:predicted acylesterase/phospholipase RssA
VTDRLRILSIDGGGIRGLIPALFLTELERVAGRPVADLFDVVAGTSKGGIIALTLAAPGPDGRPRWTAADVVGLYETWGPRVFSRTVWHRLRSAEGGLDEKYPATQLETMLARYLGDTPLSAALVDVFITSYDTEHRAPKFFRSWRAKANPADDFPMRLVARATSAAPTYFEPLRLPTGDEGAYLSLIDGGVFANSPALCAYVEALKVHPGAEIELVSVGTGRLTRPLPYDQIRDWGALSWARPILDVVFDGIEQATDHQLGLLVPAERYHRFQVPLDARSEHIDDAGPENLAALREKAETLIAAHAGALPTLCARLIR